MEALLKFLADNIIIVCVAAAAIIAIVIVFVSISAKNARIKRDAEYAKMLEEVPIENDDREDVSFGDGQRPEFEKTEMDWLKGEKGYFGVLRTELPPLKNEAKEVKEEVKENKEVKEPTPEEAATETNSKRAQKDEKPKKADKSRKNNAKDRKIFVGERGERGERVERSERDVSEQKSADKKAESEQQSANEILENKQQSANEKPESEQKNELARTEIRQLKIDDIADENAAKITENEEENEMAVKKAESKPEKKASKSSVKFAEKFAEKALEKAPAPANAPLKKAVGKWVIKEKGEGEFVAYLYANNKELMLTSETYSTPDGAKKGIGTIQKNAAISENFTYYRDKKKNYYFKLKTSQNRFLCVGETYPNKSACLKSIESVKKFVDSPVSDVVEKDITIIKYVPAPEKDSQTKKYSGKWVITPIDDEFMAQLRASNGELLLSSESYTSYASAKEAIDNITKNAEAGNFIIDSDKKGRYFFKLRNDHKLTLCIGETYSQLSACQSAIESVRSFLKTAKLAENQ